MRSSVVAVDHSGRMMASYKRRDSRLMLMLLLRCAVQFVLVTRSVHMCKYQRTVHLQRS
jgi:hypothetical protein